MAEKRKPLMVLLLRYRGTVDSVKVEVFPAELWDPKMKRRYRVRVGGKWYGGARGEKSFITKWEFRDILFRSMKF